MRPRLSLWALFLLLCAFWGSGPAVAGEKIPVFVSIPPQKYFVEKIGGNFVQVSVMVPPEPILTFTNPVIFVQPQFSTKSAQTLAKAIGGEVVFADNLREDWEKNLRVQAEKFKQALAAQTQ